MNYTKGEWKSRRNPNNGFDNDTEIIAGKSNAIIAKMDDGWDDPTIEANAHLIAAAPDMYEALKALDDYCQFDVLLKHNRALQMRCRQALAKAESLK